LFSDNVHDFYVECRLTYCLECYYQTALQLLKKYNKKKLCLSIKKSYSNFHNQVKWYLWAWSLHCTKQHKLFK